jgi:hypothetical protein
VDQLRRGVRIKTFKDDGLNSWGYALELRVFDGFAPQMELIFVGKPYISRRPELPLMKDVL